MATIDCMTDQDVQVIGECLHAAAHGPFFPDWEFQTLMGFTREEIAAIAERWPHVGDADELDDAVNNVLNNLLGYPHGLMRRWHEYCSATPREVEDLLRRWRADAEFDETHKGTFGRLR